MKLLFAIGGAALALTLSHSPATQYGAGVSIFSSAAAQVGVNDLPAGTPTCEDATSYPYDDGDEKMVWCNYSASTAQRDFYLTTNNGNTWNLQNQKSFQCNFPNIFLIKAQIGAANCSTVCAPTSC